MASSEGSHSSDCCHVAVVICMVRGCWREGLSRLTTSRLLVTGNLLGAKHAAERLQRCWVHPSGQAFSIKHLRKSFKVRSEACTPTLTCETDMPELQIPTQQVCTGNPTTAGATWKALKWRGEGLQSSDVCANNPRGEIGRRSVLDWL